MVGGARIRYSPGITLLTQTADSGAVGQANSGSPDIPQPHRTKDLYQPLIRTTTIARET